VAFDRTRRTSDPRQAAEAAFKAATTKPLAPIPAAPQKPALPNAKELVSLRLDRDVLEHFQESGPGWQDRINAVLRATIGK
jgi:uncharacterized protein (DUF4415 family)